MRKPVTLSDNGQTYLPPLPSWVTRNYGKAAECEAFISGASLAMLHMMLADPVNILPAELLRTRLALRAAEVCLKLEGRRDSEAEIRDAYYLAGGGANAIGATGPDSAMGPAGEMYVRWRKLSAIGLKRGDWLVRLRSSVPEQVAEKLPEWIDTAMDQGAGQGRSPVAQAEHIIALVMAAFPREEASALICGDLVLARALGWAHPVPLLGVHLKRKDLLRAAGVSTSRSMNNLDADCRTMRFVGLDAYKEAGGTVSTNLFDDDATVDSIDLLERLFAEKLEEEADKVQKAERISNHRNKPENPDEGFQLAGIRLALGLYRASLSQANHATPAVEQGRWASNGKTLKATTGKRPSIIEQILGLVVVAIVVSLGVQTTRPLKLKNG